MTQSFDHLLVLGCGYTGLAVSRLATERGLTVLATTRRGERSEELRAAGARPIVLETLTAEGLAGYVDAHTAIIATYPPDGTTDALLAPLLRNAYGGVYVSSTGVYGDTRGPIDHTTPPVADSTRSAQRLEAEAAWLSAGATVLRCAAIYGPFRGQHERVRSGSARIAGDGRHHICRIHVEDLAQALLAALDRKLGATTYVIADDQPAPQGEVIRYLAELLGVPVPASVPLDSAPETLRHDRQIDASAFKAAAHVHWRYPNYRVGFPACLRAEATANQTRTTP